MSNMICHFVIDESRTNEMERSTENIFIFFFLLFFRKGKKKKKKKYYPTFTSLKVIAIVKFYTNKIL